MSPFSFHVPSSHYRARPSVRLAVRPTREPFRVSLVDVCEALALVVVLVVGLALAVAPVLL